MSEGVELQEESQNGLDISKERQAYETILRSKLEQTEDFPYRAMAICMLRNWNWIGLDRKGRGQSLKVRKGLRGKSRPIGFFIPNATKLGLISSKDLTVMWASMKNAMRF